MDWPEKLDETRFLVDYNSSGVQILDDYEGTLLLAALLGLSQCSLKVDEIGWHLADDLSLACILFNIYELKLSVRNYKSFQTVLRSGGLSAASFFSFYKIDDLFNTSARLTFCGFITK